MLGSSLLQEPDGFEDDILPSIWRDEFFGPLLESSRMKEFCVQQHMMMMEPAFKMDEDGDQVALVISIPDVTLKDIDIEVIGGRIIHIRASPHFNFEEILYWATFEWIKH